MQWLAESEGQDVRVLSHMTPGRAVHCLRLHGSCFVRSKGVTFLPLPSLVELAVPS